LAPEGLFLVMQPIMALKAPYESLNFEVLLRMREDDGSILPAGPIIAAAENNGRIGIIDRWVLTTTLEWIDANATRLDKTKFICMNLSGASLNDERFIQDAFEIIGRHKDATTRLCIEITEGVALQDIDNTQRFINRVRSHGAKIALDDFGAGYTSFSYLKELSAEVLKIDGMFVKGIATHPANLAIIEAIVALARNLGMRTIAEWAEDAATAEALAMVGIDYVQGYAISRPVSPEQILKADSAASFVTDARLQQFLRNQITMGVPTTFWDSAVGLDPKGMH
jgi:EAL domain-containing protein (putative c-di-GMP-specific phosphodiesterase class I)